MAQPLEGGSGQVLEDGGDSGSLLRCERGRPAKRSSGPQTTQDGARHRQVVQEGSVPDAGHPAIGAELERPGSSVASCSDTQSRAGARRTRMATWPPRSPANEQLVTSRSAIQRYAFSRPGVPTAATTVRPRQEGADGASLRARRDRLGTLSRRDRGCEERGSDGRTNGSHVGFPSVRQSLGGGRATAALSSGGR